MNRRINVEEVCRAYNNARDENKGRTGSPSWASKILKEKGLSTSIIKRILHEPTLVIYSKRENAGRGNYKGCTFPYNPIHKDWFENWIYPPKKDDNCIKKDLPFEEECTSYLKARGYEIKKCVGFDEDRFAEEHPELYKQYLIYECI